MLRLRPRISILTALLLMTIVGMAIVLVQLWREVGPLRAENSSLRTDIKKLHAELAYLTIEDPNKAYAISLPTFDTTSNTSTWRIYLPSGRYTLNTYSGHLPGHLASAAFVTDKAWFDQAKKAGVGGSLNVTSLSGEFVLEARTVKVRDKWMLVTKCTKRGEQAITSEYREMAISQPNGDWLSNRGTRRGTTDVNDPIQRSFEPDEPILLLLDQRVRYIKQPDGSTILQPMTETADAYALWIEPIAPAVKADSNK